MMNQYGFQFRAFDHVSAVMQNINAALGKTEKKAHTTQQMLGGMGGLVTRMSGMGGLVTRMMGGLAIGYAATDVYQVTKSYEQLTNTLRFASGDAATYNQHLKFVNETVDKMGLPLNKSIEGFTQLTAAMRGGKLEHKVEDIFRGVSTGASVLGLNAEKTERVYLALSQIASKGKVQAEELRGQIGEAMPGAFRTAAKAMGVTEKALNKMLDTGKVNANDFLDKFAAAMEQEYAGGLDKAANSSTAKYNRFINEVMRAKIAFGNIAMPFVSTGLEALTGLFERLGGWIDRNKESISAFFTSITYWKSRVFNTLGGLVDTYWPVVKKFYEGMVVFAKALWVAIQPVVVMLGDVFSVFYAWVVKNQDMLIKIGALIGGLVVALVTWVSRIVAFFGYAVSGLVMLGEYIVKIWVGFWSKIISFYQMVFNQFMRPFRYFMNVVAPGVGRMFSWLFDQAYNLFLKPFADTYNAIMAVFGKKVEVGVSANKDFKPVPWEDEDSANTVYADGRKFGEKPYTPKGLSSADLGTNQGISGGSTVKHITISIQKLVESLNVNTTNLTEGGSQIKEQLTRLLLDASNDVNYAN